MGVSFILYVLLYFVFQAANDPTLMKRRLWRYLGPVTLLSILINTSKFFEAYVDTNDKDEYVISRFPSSELSFSEPLTKGCVIFIAEISDLRRNHIYSAITNWMRLIFMSFLPLLIIIFFNFKVYKDIKERSKRSFELKGSPETRVNSIVQNT